MLQSHSESDPPPGPFPVLPGDEAHPVQRDPESPNACQASLFGAPPAGVRVTSLRLDYLPRQARLIVFQAFPNENLKPVVILGKLVRRLISLRLVGLHFRIQIQTLCRQRLAFPRTPLLGRAGEHPERDSSGIIFAWLSNEKIYVRCLRTCLEFLHSPLARSRGLIPGTSGGSSTGPTPPRRPCEKPIPR